MFSPVSSSDDLVTGCVTTRCPSLLLDFLGKCLRGFAATSIVPTT